MDAIITSSLFFPLILLLVSTLVGLVVSLVRENSALRKDYIKSIEDKFEQLSLELKTLSGKVVIKEDHAEVHKVLNGQVLSLQQACQYPRAN